MKAELPPEIFKEVETNILLMKDLSSGLLKVGPAFSELVGDQSNHELPSDHGLRVTAEGAGLRQLQALLKELDKSHDWGGLRCTLTPTGDYLWLCPKHYHEYDPGLPDRGFEVV